MTRTMTCAIGMLLACGTACGVRGDNGHPERQLVLRDSTDWSNGKGSTRRLQLVNVSDRPILDVLKDELIEELLGRGCTLLLEPTASDDGSSGRVLGYSPEGEFPGHTEVRIRVSFPVDSSDTARQ